MPERTGPIILSASSNLDEAVRAVRNGGVVAYPTETLYGLGVDPFNERAVERLFSLKGREKGKPVPLIVRDRAMLCLVAEDIPAMAERLMERFWPGPLTIVFKAGKTLPLSVTGGGGTIGVRVSSGHAARALVSALASPLTATSANPSGRPASVTASDVLDYFDGGIDVLVDGGRLQGKAGSTVVDVTGKNPRIIREGAIPSGEVLKTG